MFSSFLNRFGPLLVLTNPLNEGFPLYFLRTFLITLACHSSILLHLFILCPLCCPPTVLHAMGGQFKTLPLPPLTIPTADRRPRTTS